MDKRLAECQRVIGYHFANPELLEIALTHSSLRSPDRECNERLEFLGDSVLGLVITEELYRLLPDQAEGELTRIKSAVVSRGALYRASTKLGLARFADFARGVGRRHELPVSVIANLVESVIGAIYLDAGYFPAREFVLRHLGDELDDTLNDRGAKNYKSLLQHDAQQNVSSTPTYRMVEEEGPHHRKQFTVAAVIQGQEWGRGAGATKKEAEQEAARKALEAWQRRGRGRRRRRRRGGEAGPEPRAARAEAQAEGTGRSRRVPRPAADARTGDAAGRGDEPSGRRRRRGGRAREEAAPEPTRDADAPAPAPAAPRPRRESPPPVADFAAGLDEAMPRHRHPETASPRHRETAPEAEEGERPRRSRRRSTARRDRGEAARQPEAVPAPPEETPPPPRPRSPAEDDGFAEGIPVSATGSTRAREAPRPPEPEDADHHIQSRRKAPVERAPPPEEGDGFDAGL